MTKISNMVVGFCGGNFCSHCAGKTTAANFLVKKHNFYLCDLLNPVEESAMKLCNWDGKKDKNGLSILNQVCESGRKINENYWLNISLASIPKNVDKIVFDNVYFKNESEFIVNNGFLIYVERIGFYKEKPIDDLNYNYFISNDGSLDNFENKIDDLINILYNEKTTIKNKDKKK
jgi:hypothetical protein